MSDYLVWIDCEMTGLDLRADALIEVACLVTDDELNVVGDGVDVVIKPPEDALDTMPDVVRAMHTTSGLLDELDARDHAGRGRGTGAARTSAQYVPEVAQGAAVPATRSRPTAASIARDLPALDDHLHYRMIDVSSRSRSWPGAGTRGSTSRARPRRVATARSPTSASSIEELRYYREALFVPQPGPDTDTAKAIAASIGADDGSGHRAQPEPRIPYTDR